MGPNSLSMLRTGILAIALPSLLASCTSAVGLSETAEDSASANSSEMAEAPIVAEPSKMAETAEVAPALQIGKSPEADTSFKAESSQCQRLTDFETAAEQNAWMVINDNIMGGRSQGGPTFENSVMTFSGNINTNGGGFSSVRTQLKPNALAPYSKAVLRVRPDDRAYRLIVEDNLKTRSARTVHRKNIEFDSVGEWQTVSISFDQLQPSIFGDPVEAPRLQKDLAFRLGLMLNDVGDGPFQIEVDWIDACV